MKIRELLTDESKWCTRHALDSEGNDVQGDDPRAVRWGLGGAIEKCYPVTQTDELCTDDPCLEVFARLYRVVGMSVHNFNWSHDFAAIRRVIEEADV